LIQFASRTVVIALLYFLSAKAVSPLSLVESSSVFAIWPPTGVALSALLLYGYRSWMGIALGALFLNMTLTPLLPSLQITLTNTLGPLLGAWIVFRFGGGYNFFASLRTMVAFFIAITAASLVTAWGGSTALLFHGFIGMPEHFAVSYTWFLGDLIGFLVITPLVVAIRLECQKLFFYNNWGEILLISLFILGGGLVFFGPLGFFDQAKYPIAYMFFIPVLWASIRFGALGGSFSVVLTSLIVVAGTVYGYGSFVRPDPNDTLLLLQGYVWFMGVIAFFVATILRQKEIIHVSLLQTQDELKTSLQTLQKYQKNLEKRVEEELAKRREQEQIMIQQSKLAAMGEMVGMIAHQWRQPLNAIGLLIQDMKDAQEFGELDEAYLDTSVESTMQLIQFMSATIDDFRNFFKQDKEKKNFSVKEILDGVASVIGASLKNNLIELAVDAREPIEIYGYHHEYMQVVLNIINNAKDALKRSAREDKRISIEWMKTAEGKSRVIIADNGGGIPEDILPKIYEPYFTTKEQGHGTGIGLYMSKMIIERHMNGTLKEENVDDGVRFIIEV
jgi:signal transduction histidine kinase